MTKPMGILWTLTPIKVLVEDLVVFPLKRHEYINLKESQPEIYCYGDGCDRVQHL